MDERNLKSLVEVKREAIVEALRRTGGNKDGAAYFLGIGRSTLYRYMKALEIMPHEYIAKPDEMKYRAAVG